AETNERRSWWLMLASEVEVGADADGLDLVLEELAVGGAAQEVLEQDLHLARGQHAVDLDAGPQREVAAPVVLLAMLHVDGGDRPPALATTRPRAGHLGAVLDRPRAQVRRVGVEDVAETGVEPQPVPEFVRHLGVDPLVAEVHALGLGAQEELVAEMARLVEDAQQRRQVVVAVAERDGHEVIGVDQVLREGVEIEDREDAGLDAELPPRLPEALADEGEGLAEADRG